MTYGSYVATMKHSCVYCSGCSLIAVTTSSAQCPTSGADAAREVDEGVAAYIGDQGALALSTAIGTK
jgi:hypothetical protein